MSGTRFVQPYFRNVMISLAILSMIAIATSALSDYSSGDPEVFTDEGVTYTVEDNILTICSADENDVSTPDLEGETVFDILENAGISTTDIDTVIFDDSVIGIGDNAFSGCNSIVNVTFGDELICVGDLAFSSCDKITTLVLPDSVQTIGEETFSGLGLSDLLLGPNVDSIGNYAFADNFSLETVMILAQSIETLDSNIFGEENPADLKIYVPAGRSSDYKDAWEQYEDIIYEWILRPEANTDLTYDGTEKTGVDDGIGYTLTDSKKTNADDYQATATLISGNIWSDFTSDPYIIDWSISKATITSITTEFSPVYDGNTHIPSNDDLIYNGLIVRPSSTNVTISLDGTDGVSAAEQSLKITVFGDGNFNDTADIPVTYNIQKSAVTAITTDFNPTYNSTIQTPTVGDLVFGDLSVRPDASNVTIELDRTDGSSAIEQHITVSISGDDNFSDVSDIEVTYCIEKAVLSSISTDFNPSYNAKPQIPSFSQITFNLDFITADDIGISCSNNIDAGIADLTVSSVSDNITGSAASTFTINKASLNGVSVKEGEVFTYSGNSTTPSFQQISFNAPGTISESDIEISASNNINAGTATLTVSCKEVSVNYTGSAQTVFTIGKATIGAVSVLSDATFTYTGEAQTPKFEQIYIETPGTITAEDVTITASNNINAGTSIMTVTAKESSVNYTGTSNCEFTIEKADIVSVSLKEDTTFVFNGNEQTPTFDQLNITAPGTVSADDVTITASNNIHAGDANVTVSAKVSSVNYKGSVGTQFTIAKFTIDTVSIKDGESFTYSGSSIVPAFDQLVFAVPGNLTADDVSITASNNIDAGIADLLVTVRSDSTDYQGSASTSFIIQKAAIGKVSIASGITFTYTGEPQIPTFDQIIIDVPGKISESDVSITASNNIDAGVATFTVVAMDTSVNYTGQSSGTFVIQKAEITEISMTEGTSFVYNGKEQKVSFEQIVFTAPGTVKESDVSITVSDNIDAGTAKVRVSCNDDSINYTGTAETTFVIDKATIGLISLNKDVIFIYDRTEKIPSFEQLSIEAPGKITKDDVSITAENNIDAGTATATVTAKDDSRNYKGTSSLEFTITKRTVDIPKVADNEYTWIGSDITFKLPTSEWYSVKENITSAKDSGKYVFHLILDKNCVWSDDKYDGTYTVFIKETVKKHLNQDNVEDVIVITSKGIRSDYDLSVNKVSDTKDIGKLIGVSDSSVKYVYDIKLLNNGNEVEPGSSVTLKLMVPDGIGDSYDIYHIHGSSVTKMPHSTDGKYAEVTINEFSQFAFVVNENNSSSGIDTMVIIIAIVIIATLAIGAFVIIKKKKTDGISKE